MKKVLKVVVCGAVLGLAVVSAQAQTDPTTIYANIGTDYDAAIGFAITAIGIGAAIMYIRKGLKARS